MTSLFDTSDFDKKIKELINSVPEMLTDKMEKVCLKVEGDAKKNCSVNDGILRASITHTVESHKDSVEGFIGSSLDYAPFVHQGTGLFAKSGNGRKAVPWRYKDSKGVWHSTKGQKPNPFLQKAIDSNRTQILEYLKGVLKNDN